MFHRFLKGVAISAIIAFPSWAAAQNAPEYPPISTQGAEEANRLLQPFFLSLQAGNAPQAYADLFRGTLLETKVLEVSQLAAQTTVVLQTYGALNDWELVRSECPTTYVCKLVYFMRMDKGATAFWAYLYRRPDGSWQPSTVLMGDTPQFFFN